MAQLPFDGNFRVFVVDTVADIAAPTSAEITAGTEITALLPKSGWSETPTFNRVAAGNMSTLYDAEVMGTWKTTITLTILLDDTADLAWDEFQVQGARTNLVVLPYKGVAAVAAADKSRCYPVEVARAIPNASAANERQTAEVACAVYSEPALDGAVAA